MDVDSFTGKKGKLWPKESKMNDLIAETKLLAEQAGFEFQDRGNGHIQIISETNLVNYYPLSKKKTAHSPPLEKKVAGASPADAIALCLESRAEGSALSWERFQTNPAGIQNHYAGDKAPWEFDTFVCSQSDRLRIASHKLWRRAQDLNELADNMERPVRDLAETDLQRAAKEMQVRLGLA